MNIYSKGIRTTEATWKTFKDGCKKNGQTMQFVFSEMVAKKFPAKKGKK